MRVNISRTRAASGSTTCVLPPEPADDRRQDDHRDVAVDVEEGDVEAGGVAPAQQRVLVEEARGPPAAPPPDERPDRQHPPPRRRRRRRPGRTGPARAW